MDLSIIIVNWNAGPLLRRCLDALPAAGRGNSEPRTGNSELEYEVIVVDNASRDDSLSRAQGSEQPFRLQALPENVGFAHANNLGMEQAQGDMLLLLNPDTEPRPQSLAALADFFQSHPRAGVVGGKLLHPDGSVQRSVRTLPNPVVLGLLLTRLARLTPWVRSLHAYGMTGFTYDRDAPVEQVMGACFAIRRETLYNVGPLDDGFWIWFEEVDYCARVLAAGWEVWFAPGVNVVHHGAVSFRQVSALRRAWWFCRSALRYSAKHHGRGAAALLSLLVPVSLLTALLATLTGMRPGVLNKPLGQ